MSGTRVSESLVLLISEAPEAAAASVVVEEAPAAEEVALL